jgi:general secretion pathway protein I
MHVLADRMDSPRDSRHDCPPPVGLRPARSQRGYTLIEVIVAFALLAAALTLLLGTLSGATRQVRWSGDAGRAALHAQSLLDTVGIIEPLKTGERQGDFDDGRYRWSLRISPWEDPALANRLREPAGPVLYELDLDVRWGDGGPREHLQLRSLRLGSPHSTVGGAP